MYHLTEKSKDATGTQQANREAVRARVMSNSDTITIDETVFLFVKLECGIKPRFQNTKIAINSC